MNNQRAEVERVETWAGQLDALLQHIGPPCPRSETRQRTGIYLQALLSPGERKNARQSAEIMGNVTSCRAQQFLYRPIWDPDQPSLLFLDRGPWYQGPPIQALLAANPRLELVYFPTAAPDLNPQEIGYAQCSSGRIG